MGEERSRGEEWRREMRGGWACAMSMGTQVPLADRQRRAPEVPLFSGGRQEIVRQWYFVSLTAADRCPPVVRLPLAYGRGGRQSFFCICFLIFLYLIFSL